MKSSPVVKRSIVIGGHKTSVSLEDAFWTGMKDIAHADGVTLTELASKIDGTRDQGNLSSALRQYVLHHFRNLFLLQKLGSEDERMGVAQAHLSPERATISPDSPSIK
jgi:predicted DNA-binding ribbon-helix-helix protein